MIYYINGSEVKVMSKKKKYDEIASIVVDVLASDKVKKTLFGTYSNGKARNLSDAIHKEVISPEDKLLIAKRLKKNKKKKKKNKKHGKFDLTM